MNNPEIDEHGSLRWYNEKGEYHREDGPAFIRSDGDCYWYKNGKYHREDGPAIECTIGHKEWWVNGEFIKGDYAQT